MRRVIVSFVLVLCLVSLVFLSAGASADDVGQKNLGQADSQGQVDSDDAAVSVVGAVPEPGTMAIIGIGALALLVRKRRRKIV